MTSECGVQCHRVGLEVDCSSLITEKDHLNS